LNFWPVADWQVPDVPFKYLPFADGLGRYYKRRRIALGDALVGDRSG
jgi:hypothetical protein